MFGLTCFCCGADITCPQFFNGKAYGYTCITKVSGQKRIKDNGLWIAVDSIDAVVEGSTVVLKAYIGGLSFSATVINHPSFIVQSGFCVDSKMIKVAQYSNGTKPLYRSLIIDQVRDDKGNLRVKCIKSTKNNDFLLTI